jgi:ribosomal-protein-alanine N-acetyltransferase
MIVVETSQLLLRHLAWDDLEDLAALYADPVIMRFISAPRTYEETQHRLAEILSNYEAYGYGLWATIHKADNQFIGRCGLIPQRVDGEPEVEIGYMLAKEYWGQGLATEAARAIRDYGFEKLGFDRLISLIDPENIASQKIALKNGLTYEKDTRFIDRTIRVYAIHKSQVP